MTNTNLVSTTEEFLTSTNTHRAEPTTDILSETYAEYAPSQQSKTEILLSKALLYSLGIPWRPCNIWKYSSEEMYIREKVWTFGLLDNQTIYTQPCYVWQELNKILLSKKISWKDINTR